MTPAEQFVVWRAELVEERTSVLEQLEAARAQLQAAEERHEREKAAVAALNKFVSGCRGARDGAVISLAGPLYARLTGAREPLKAAQSERAAVGAAMHALEVRAAELQDAVDQVDRALTAEKVTELRPPAGETSRRRHQPTIVDYDTIRPSARDA